MFERELCAVKRHSPYRIRRASVRLIADDWMSASGQVNANLMFAARFQANFEERRFWTSLQYSDMRDGESSDFPVCRRVNLKRGVLGQVSSDGELVRLDTPLDNRHISASG